MKYRAIVMGAALMVGSIYGDTALDPAFVSLRTHAREAVSSSKAEAALTPSYKNRVGVGFNRVVYERLNDDHLYFAVDGWASTLYSHARHDRYGAILEAEGRIGYHYQHGVRDSFIPLAGVGYLFHNTGAFHRAQVAYATAGARYVHIFNSILKVGLNVKGLAGQQMGNKMKKRFAWGVDVSLPLVFRFAHHRNWSIALEPYYLYLESHHRHQGVFGERATIGYLF